MKVLSKLTKKELIMKLNALEKEFEHLKEISKRVYDFDDIYNTIQKNYIDSKSLIDQQIKLFDKKIIENSGVVDERFNSYEKRLTSHFEALDQKNDEQFKKTISAFKLLIEQYDEKAKEFKEDVESLKKEYLKYLGESGQAFLEKQKETLEVKYENFSNKLDYLYSQNQEKVKKLYDDYELNLNTLVDNSVSKEINNRIVGQIVAESVDKILYSFNKSLVELSASERETIIDSIKAIITPNLPIVNKGNDEVLEIKSISKQEIFHESYNKLKVCVEAGIIPMLVGPAGTGKSTAAEQLSRDLGLNFYMANRIQNTFELVGFVNAAGEYVTTQFYEAYTKGGIFLFDEVDASSPEALVTINAAIAQGYMAFPGHPTAIKMHENFKAICAGNTFGTGSTLQYTGRNKLDSATLDRFMIIEWDYDKTLEEKMVADKDLLNLCWALRTACLAIDKSIIISTRGIFTLDKMLAVNKESKVFQIKELFKQKFFENVSKANLKKIFNAISDSCKGNFFLKFIEELSE